MAFEEIKDNIIEAEASAKSYLENSQKYYKLKGFKVMMKAIIVFAKIASVSVMLILALLFLSASAAFFIGESLEKYSFRVSGGRWLLYSFRPLNLPIEKQAEQTTIKEILRVLF